MGKVYIAVAVKRLGK